MDGKRSQQAQNQPTGQLSRPSQARGGTGRRAGLYALIEALRERGGSRGASEPVVIALAEQPQAPDHDLRRRGRRMRAANVLRAAPSADARLLGIVEDLAHEPPRLGQIGLSPV